MAATVVVVEMEAAVETDLTVTPRLPPPASSATKRAFGAGQLGALVIGALLGAAGGVLGSRLGASLLLPGLPKWALLFHLLALPLVWLIVVAFHELGHLVGGWAGGGRFMLYVVGPFMWKRTPAGVRFSWNKNVNIGGGLAACLPLDPSQTTPHRTAVMIAGGPLFSLLLALLALWLAAGLAAIATTPALIFAQHFAVIVAGMSVLIFFATVIPASAGGFKSDGRRFYELLRGDERSAQECAMLALTTASLAGVRPADYEPRLVAQAIGLRDGSLFDLYAHLTVAHHFADVGQPGRAQALLDHVLAHELKLVPFARDTLRCDYAWLLARHTADTAGARAWLDSAGPLDIDPATRLRAEAAVLLAEGRRAEAATQARAALHAAEHRSLSPVRSAYMVDTCETILRAAETPA